MTTSTEPAEEVPFLRGMEREGNSAPGDSTTVLRFEVDGLKQKVHEIGLRTSEVAAAAMRAVKAAMGMHAHDHDAQREPIDYVRGDDEPRIRRKKPVPPRTDRALWVSVASLLITAGGIIFWTGRFTAQAESVQRIQTEQADAIREGGAANARQDVTLGIIGQQYAEITRRLNSIEQKVDSRP